MGAESEDKLLPKSNLTLPPSEMILILSRGAVTIHGFEGLEPLRPFVFRALILRPPFLLVYPLVCQVRAGPNCFAGSGYVVLMP